MEDHGISFAAHTVQVAICEEAAIVRGALTAPHVLMKPTLVPDGNQWSALYGENLVEGVAGFGDTPEEAMADFDKNWREQIIHKRCPDCGRAVDDDGYTLDPDGACFTCKAD